MPFVKFNAVNAQRRVYKKMLEEGGAYHKHYEDYPYRERDGDKVVTLIAWLLERAGHEYTLEPDEDTGNITVARTTFKAYTREQLEQASQYLLDFPEEPEQKIKHNYIPAQGANYGLNPALAVPDEAPMIKMNANAAG